MRLNLMTSLIAATAIFNSVSPALAQSQSWIDRDVLAENHRAYCDDIVAQDTRVNSGSILKNDNGSTSSYYNNSTKYAHHNSKQTSVNAGFNYLKIGGNLGGSQKTISKENNSQNSTSKQENTWNQDSRTDYDRTTITSKVVGENCKAFVDNAARIQMNQDIQKTQRMQIQTQKQLGVFKHLTDFGD